jgi:hypothetical protein
VQILGGRVVWSKDARSGEEVGAGACQRNGDLERGAQFGKGRIWSHFGFCCLSGGGEAAGGFDGQRYSEEVEVGDQVSERRTGGALSEVGCVENDEGLDAMARAERVMILIAEIDDKTGPDRDGFAVDLDIRGLSLWRRGLDNFSASRHSVSTFDPISQDIGKG